MGERRRTYSTADRERAVRMVDDGRSAAAVARELGLDAGTLRRWVRTARGNEWAAQVARRFGFLTRHGFALTDVDASEWWEVRVTYRSPRSAVAVIRSNEFRRVEVELMRLVDGDLPAYPIFVVDSVPLNTFYADDLLVLRGLDPAEIAAGQGGLSAQQVEAQLAFWSSALREYGQYFLAGDLRVLDELESMVRGRVRQLRQEVTVWLPDGASADEQDRAVERARAGLPEGVAVTARRYRQTTRR